MASALGRRLVACLLNISEARQRGLVEKVAQAAITDDHGIRRKGTTVLNIFSDYDYNRSVITIVASIELITLAAALIERVLGTSAFFFGWADVPIRRGLAQRRKEIGWSRKVLNIAAIQPDIGPQPTRQYGLTGVGASPYVMNCNVTIDTQDLVLGRGVAAAIRESSPGGIQGVQVMALPHEGAIEIACNVESVLEGPPSDLAADMEPWPAFNIGGQNFYHAPASLITARVTELAGRHGVATKGTALVGFTPLECKGLAEMALSQDIGEFWKMLHSVRM
ncbi:formiminotransferase N-terminal subdomain-containing protein isoform X2 [Pygocentrus nattereri]|uniref:formiminotransferase N-terminal subdomain-containing protein isoform X2 n=1 Tax=Pygocentrus nattereri TaxID=42514 RepID=UPI0018913BB9|nr:formiminotransferase N-terminal subdomain-containing protein isoform X2 [Pygocentrus nattereri]